MVVAVGIAVREKAGHNVKKFHEADVTVYVGRFIYRKVSLI